MIVVVAGPRIYGLHEASHVLEISRCELPKRVEAVSGEEGGRYAILHVGGHGLHGFLADLWKLPGFVGHAAMLPAHAQGTRFAGVPGAHGPQGLDDPAGAPGDPKRVPDGWPASPASKALLETHSFDC
jgi:hypothetical protein